MSSVEQAGFRILAALADLRIPGLHSSRVLLACSTSIGDFIVMLPFLAQVTRDEGEYGVDIFVISRFGPIAETIVPSRCKIVTLEVDAMRPFIRNIAHVRALLRRRRYAKVQYIPHSTEEIIGRARKLALIRLVAGFRPRCAGFGVGPALMTRRSAESSEGAEVVHQCLQPFAAATVVPRIARTEVMAFLEFRQHEHQRVNDLLSTARQAGRPLVGIFVGSRLARKTWPRDRYEVLARSLIDAGCRIAFLGAAEDRVASDAVRRKLGSEHTMQWCGATSIRESILLYGALNLVLGNDGAPLHLAALGGAPAVSLFCNWEVPGIWEPILAPASRSIRPAWTLRRHPESYGIENVPLSAAEDAAFELLRGASGHEVWTASEDGRLSRRSIPGFF